MTLNERPKRSSSPLREFLAVTNLQWALLLSAVVTALSIPRITIAGYGLFPYVPAAWVSMTLICGSVTAWSGVGIMSRLWPARNVLIKGAVAALALGLAFGLAKSFFLDPILEQAMVRHLAFEEMELHFPRDGYGVFALILWVAGFETLFFEGGTMSLWARVTGSVWVATAVTVFMRMGVVLYQMNRIYLGDWLVPILLAYVIAQIVGCQLMARAGLVPVMLYNAALQVGLVAAVF